MIGFDPRPSRLALRAAVLAVGLFYGWIAFQASWAGAFSAADPEAVLKIAPHDAAAGAAAGTRLIVEAPSPAALDRARALAVASLRRDATEVAALRTLGLIADARGNMPEAERLFAAVEARSKRDLATQLWLLERRTQLGDVAGALSYYERTLDAIYTSWPVLFPVLSGASADPALERPIAAMLVRNRHKEWWSRMAAALVDTAPDPARAAAIGLRVFDPADPGQRGYLAALLGRLGVARDYAAGAVVYRRLRGGDAGMTGRRGFADDFGDGDLYPPFDWSLAADADFTATRAPAPNGHGNVLQLAAGAGRGGDLARRLIALAPGRYRLSLAAGNLSPARSDRPSLVVTCAEPEATAALATLLIDDSRQSGEIRIPAQCRRQWLIVRMTRDGPEPIDRPWIGTIRADPIGG